MLKRKYRERYQMMYALVKEEISYVDSDLGVVSQKIYGLFTLPKKDPGGIATLFREITPERLGKEIGEYYDFLRENYGYVNISFQKSSEFPDFSVDSLTRFKEMSDLERATVENEIVKARSK